MEAVSEAEEYLDTSNEAIDKVVDEWDDSHHYERKVLVYRSSVPSGLCSPGCKGGQTECKEETPQTTTPPQDASDESAPLTIRLYQHQTSFRALNTVGLTVWKSVRPSPRPEPQCAVAHLTCPERGAGAVSGGVVAARRTGLHCRQACHRARVRLRSNRHPCHPTRLVPASF
jgi:hypothetical protein